MARRTVEVLLKAKDGTKQATTSAGKGFKDLEKTIGISGKAIAGFGAAAVAALGLATTAVFKFLESVANMEDQMAKAARRAQVDIGTYGEWSHVIQLAGGSAQTFEKAIQALSRQMVTAQQGSTTVAQSFTDIGVNIYTMTGELKAADVVFEETVAGLQGMSDASKRSGIAQILMSRAGKILIPVLEQTTEQLAAQRLEYLDLGGRAITAASVTGENWIDAQLRVKVATDGIKASFLSAFGPEVTAMINGMSEVIASLGSSFSESGTLDSVKEINELFDKLVEIADVAPAGFRAMGEAWDLSVSLMTGNAHSFGLSLVQMKQAMDAAANPEYGSRPIDWENWNFGAETYAESVKRAHDETLALSQGLKEISAGPDPAKLLNVDDIEAVHGRIEEGARKIKEEYQAGVDTFQQLYDIMMALSFQAGDGAEKMTEGMKGAATAANALGNATGDILVEAPFKAMTDNAFKFSDALKTTVMSAIKAIIKQLLVVKAISAFGSIFGLKDGGAVPLAQGGSIPKAAYGYTIPDGHRGRDSRLIMGQPGEEVINRQLSQRLNRFITAQESAAYASPFGSGLVSSSGGGGTVVINMGLPDTMAGIDRLRETIVETLSEGGAA
jgi:hypothetical protein